MLRVRCPRCSQHAQVTPAEVVLRVAPGGARVSFVCAFCVQVVTRPVDGRGLELLRSAGVDDDDEEPHPEAPPGGAPFTLDDLLAFHELLDSGEAFARLDGPLEGGAHDGGPGRSGGDVRHGDARPA